MLALVQIALRRPYTFVVLALLILIGGTLSWLRTPTDIFPEINIPVISVVWQFTGLPCCVRFATLEARFSRSARRNRRPFDLGRFAR